MRIAGASQDVADSVRLCFMGRLIPETAILFDEQQIATRVDELGAEVAKDYNSLLLVGVLTGAFMLTTDLSRALFTHGMTDVEVDFMAVSSYKHTQVSSREPAILKDLKNPIKNRDVLLVEDIVDAGFSMAKLILMLNARGPASLKLLSLLSKSERREVEVKINYLGFDIPNKYVYGYGIDDGHEKSRILPYIGYKTT